MVALVLEVEGLTQRYGKAVAVDDVTLAFGEGVVGLVGVNGAGKSTLLRTLAGAQRPCAGVVTIEGADLYRRRSRRDALARVSLMPQSSEFPSNLTALEVVSSIAWFKGARPRLARRSAHEALDEVGLGSRMNTKLAQLSGGMLRRVSLAQAIVSKPDVLLLDEPSTGLDPEQRQSMVALVRTLPARLVIFSSHVMEDVEDVAQSVVVVDDGRVIFWDDLEKLRERGRVAMRDSAIRSRAEGGFLEVLAVARDTKAHL